MRQSYGGAETHEAQPVILKAGNLISSAETKTWLAARTTLPQDSGLARFWRQRLRSSFLQKQTACERSKPRPRWVLRRKGKWFPRKWINMLRSRCVSREFPGWRWLWRSTDAW